VWPALAVVPATPEAAPLVPAVEVRDADTMTVRGEVSAMVGMSKDLGRVADGMAMPQLTLVWKRPPVSIATGSDGDQATVTNNHVAAFPCTSADFVTVLSARTDASLGTATNGIRPQFIAASSSIAGIRLQPR